MFQLASTTRLALPRSVRRICAAAFLALALCAPCTAQEAGIHPGKRIYEQLCVGCHGANGEGVAEKYDEPLVGNRTLPSLVRYIARTMPEEDPGACVGEDAEQVAAYIFDAFYSPAAQARSNPVRASLARLTAAQYQQSVADLIGLFRGGSNRALGKERGLRAEYRGKRVEVYGPHLPLGEDEEEKKRERERIRYDQVDARVAFHFGSESPLPGVLKPEEFEVRWEGTLLAPETGTYEFIVRTENGFRLWINQQRDALIDAWVSSGPDVREERRSIFLLGGRVYPIKLEYFKYREKSASIELRWRPPHGREEIVPQQCLDPQWSPEVMVTSVQFPADDRSDGYERGTTISKEWDQATTRAALEVAAHVEASIDALAGTKPKAEDRIDKLKAFSRRFLDAALRRPVEDSVYQAVVEKSFAEAATPEIAVKRAVLFALKSPRFLYPELAHPDLDPYTLASRLALTLWDSVPDDHLMRAAKEGWIKERQQVANEIQRMLRDPRAKTKMKGFFTHWLELERADIASKDANLFPGFDETMMAELRESLWRFIEEIVWSDASDYRQLLEANYLWLNERLAHYYGREPNGPGFHKIEFNPSERAGIVTHPYLLAALSYHRTTSPIHRGVFLSRNIAGLALKNPSVAVAFEEAKFDPSLTMREKVAELTKDQSCMGCHSTINPLGFSLEHFDAVGRWRSIDNGKPVDAIAEFETDDGRSIRLTGPRDVAAYAASSESAHLAFVRQLFHHYVKQPAPAFGEDTLHTLRQRFAATGFHIQKLVSEIALTFAFHHDAAPALTAQNQPQHPAHAPPQPSQP
jgi:mono/diheme cytochrome c family protein